MRTLDSKQLKGLDEHKYSCSGRSITEPILQVFWNWLVEFVPLWVAPNVITAIGLLINILSSVLIFLCSPHATEPAPSWLYAAWSVCFFTYQSLDAIDGKQARRTKSSTPLGELFDHGCDAVSLAFVQLSACCAVLLGSNPDVLYFCYFSGSVVFYVTHWRTYVVGTLAFGKLDCTEAQLAMMFIHLVSATAGPRYWRTEVVAGFDLQLLFVIFTGVSVTYTVIRNFYDILKGGQGKNGSSVAGTSILSPAFPLLTVILLAYFIYKSSPSRIMQSSPIEACLFMGFVAAKLTINLVIAHMSKSPMPLTDQVLLAPLIMAINILCSSVIPEYHLLIGLLVYVTFDLFFTSALTCQQICQHMGIYCFQLGKRK